MKIQVIRYVTYARYVFPVFSSSFPLLSVYVLLDIFISSTDEVDLVTAFSRLSLEDPPIYEVPTGILYIFFCLACGGPSSLEGLKQALALTHVCGSWRATAIHIRHLWTYARMFLRSPFGRFDVRPHNRVMVVNSLL